MRSDSRSAIEELARMLSHVDSPEHLRDLNQCEFYERSRFNKAAKLLPVAKQKELRDYARQLNEIEGSLRLSL